MNGNFTLKRTGGIIIWNDEDQKIAGHSELKLWTKVTVNVNDLKGHDIINIYANYLWHNMIAKNIIIHSNYVSKGHEIMRILVIIITN